MKPALIFLTLALLCCCQHNDKKINDLYLQSLKDSLGNRDIPYKQRTYIALKLDTIALRSRNEVLHLYLLKTLADLQLEQKNISSAKRYLTEAITVARKNGTHGEIAELLNTMGLIYDESSELDSALKYYLLSGKAFLSLNDSLRFAKTLVNAGIMYKNMGSYTQAIETSTEAARILDAFHAKQDLSDAYTTIGNCLKSLKRLDDALNYHTNALQLRLSVNDSVGIAGSYNNLGNIYRYKKNYVKALENYYNSLLVKKKTGNLRSTAITLDNIAEVYFEQKQYRNAEAYFLETMAIHKSIDDKDGFLTAAFRLCKLLIETKRIEEAKKIALESATILHAVNSLKQRHDNAEILAKIYEQSVHKDSAIKYSKLYIAYKDSLFDLTMAQAVSETEGKYQLIQKEQQIKFGKKLQHAQVRQIETQKIYIFLLGFITLLLLIAIYRVYKLSKQRAIAKEKIEVLMAELNHRVDNNLQVILSIQQLQRSMSKDASQIAIIDDTIKQITAMNVIHKLFNKQVYASEINMHEFIDNLIKSLRIFHNSGLGNIFLDISDVCLPVEKAVVVGLILNEIITNNYKHSSLCIDSIQVDVIFALKKNKFYLQVEDNGGAWVVVKTSLGLQLIDNLVDQLNGTYQRTNGAKGMIHTIEF